MSNASGLQRTEPGDSMTRKKAPKRAFTLAAKVGAAGAIGWALASLASGEGSAHLEFDNPAHVGRYLYGDSNCTPNAQGDGTGDPINVVFWRNGEALHWYDVSYWVKWIAGLADSGGAHEWFLDHGFCSLMDSQNGTAPGWLWVDRYHARYHELPAPANAVLVPTHFEEQEWTLGCGPLGVGGHAVPDEEDYFGLPWTGFLEGRQRIIDAFSGQPAFTLQVHWWGNTDLRRQCDNGEPWSDGWVLYIDVIDVPSAGGGGNISGNGSGCPRFIPCF